MKALITGANGMLGQDLSPILEDEGYEVIETDVDSMDITDINSVKKVLTTEKPDIVFHCAAWTNVDKAEEDPKGAELINFKGTENVAKICSQLDITIVYISTDYVFDGEKPETEFYTPSDKTNPLSVYGKTKLMGEQAILNNCKKHYIVRTSWLYGINGKNFVETMLSLKDKPEIKVVNDQRGCPTWTIELANALVKIVNMPFGIYHACGSKSTTWYEFAKEIFSLSNLNVNLLPCKTEEFPRLAKIHKDSAMNNNKICRDWKLALKDYLLLRD